LKGSPIRAPPIDKIWPSLNLFERDTPTKARAVPGEKRWRGFSASAVAKAMAAKTNDEKACLHPTEHPNSIGLR